jgi:hypothetical protein
LVSFLEFCIISRHRFRNIQNPERENGDCHMSKALSFSAVFGVVPGYGHDNGLPEGTTADALVAHAWRESLEAEFAESNILVGASVTPGRVVYPASFGCPTDGEIVAVVTGNSNPKFVPIEKLDEFREAVIRVTGATKDRLAQSRVQLTFAEVDQFVYFEPADSGGVHRF